MVINVFSIAVIASGRERERGGERECGCRGREGGECVWERERVRKRERESVCRGERVGGRGVCVGERESKKERGGRERTAIRTFSPPPFFPSAIIQTKHRNTTDTLALPLATILLHRSNCRRGTFPATPCFQVSDFFQKAIETAFS